MRQEINLYTEEFIPKIHWCSFYHALLVVAVFISVLVFYSFKQYEQLSDLEKENIALMKNSEGLDDEPNQTKNLMDKIVEKRDVLERQINTLSSEVESKKKIKGVYEAEKNMGLASFYEVFVTIAKQSTRNLSVSEVGIYDGGEEVLVNGYSRTKNDIPAYLQRLKQEKSFSLTNFGLLKIERVEKLGFYQFIMRRKSSIGDVEEDNDGNSVLDGESNYNG